jgi:ribosomal protein L11 methylase PrmA
MNQAVLIHLAYRAMNEPSFLSGFLADPAATAQSMDLDVSEAEELAALGRPGFEALLGVLVVHKFLPAAVGEKLLIVPATFPGKIQSERHIVRLDQGRISGGVGEDGISILPGRAFGSGSHPTTTVCLRAIETYLEPGDRVLDLGTGSAVLAIAAVLLGAEQVDAYDIDAGALAIAKENLALNDMSERVALAQGGLEALPAASRARGYDLVVSNILTSAHRRHLDRGLPDIVRPGGHLILGGVGGRDVDGMTLTLGYHDLTVISVIRQGNWAALVASPA